MIEAMAVTFDELPDDVELLKKRVVELSTENDAAIAQLEARNAYLQMRLLAILDRRCKQSHGEPEDVVAGQTLLDFMHEFADGAAERLDKLVEAEAEQGGEPTGKADRKRKKKPGRKPLPEDLLRVPSVYELPEDQRKCSCGKPMPEIGEVTAEELAQLNFLFVHQHVRKKYACNRCEDGVIVAPGPERVLPKSMAGPSVLAATIKAKFGDHLPYYRIEKILAQQGAPVSRATLCNWMSGCSDLLRPISDEILRQILDDDYVQTDDTSKLIQRGKEGHSRYGHAWVYTNPRNMVYFDFTETRERHGPNRILENFEGYVQADAYSGYDELFRGGKAIEVACWAHAKRKFDDARETDPQNAGRALAAIRELYKIERAAKKMELPPSGHRQLRQERAPPILEALKEWLDAEQHRVLPKSPIATAIGYTINQWDALNKYLEDGRIEIDNNRSERMLRSVAVGRKNDLFVFTEETGQKATVLMSLVESCKANDIDPTVYFNEVLQEMRHEPGIDVATLTPWAWKQRRDEDAIRKINRAKAQAQIAEAVRAIARLP